MLILFLLTLPLVSTEVITLTKDNSITCVLTEDSVYSALDLLPVKTENESFGIKRPLQVLNHWINDDWNVGNTTEHSFYPVVDIRWEDFQRSSDGHISLNPKTATSFSVCSRKHLVLISEMTVGTFHRERSNNMICEWAHFLADGNRIMEISSGGNNTVLTLQHRPGFLKIKEGKLYKIHDYSFRYSTKATRDVSDLELTNLTTSSHLCISMFVSVDTDSYLFVFLQTGTALISTKVKGFNGGTVRSWRRISIKTDSYNGTGRLYFRRRTTKATGYWAIDKIHLCKPETETFTQTVKSSEYRCTTLENTPSGGDIRCETPGVLGRNCTINCSTIFGDSAPLCQEYKICSETHCGCAWGYHGSFCENPCNNGHETLNCSGEAVETADMPEEVLLSLKRVNLAFEFAPFNSTYLVNLRCHEEWCGNKSTSTTVEVSKSKSTSKVEVVPFSRYDIEVVAQNGEEQTYQSISPPSAPHPVQDVSVFSSTNDTFWLRWKQPYPPTGIVEQYTITYQGTEEERRSSNSTFACAIWKDYVCAELRDLTPHTFYHLEIKAKNMNVSDWSTPVIYGFTTNQRQSDPPRHLNLSLFSESNEAVVRWAYPLYTYGLLERFVVEVEDGTGKTTTKVKISGEQYQQKIPVGGKNFVVTVWGENSANSSKAALIVENGKWRSFFPKDSSVTQTVETDSAASFILPVSIICFLLFLVLVGYLRHKIISSCSLCKEPQLLLNEEIYLLPQVPRTDINTEELEDYMCSLHDANKLNQLKQLFLESLVDKTKSCTEASKEENINKNKDQVHIPYDSTRVVLEDLEGVSSGDYINASYIDGYHHAKTYIACQGPKFNTVLDFWRMIWTEKIEVVVMTTDFVETDGTRNCAEYWSHGLNTIAQFGNLTVTMTAEELCQHYIFRTFEISYQGAVRQLRHLQARWYQNRRPQSEEMLAVLQKLRKLETSLPIVVHSGFGSNRSGMLILCDIVLKAAEAEGTMDFVKTLKNLRQQRPLIIDEFGYFIVAHLTILEFFLAEQNPFKRTMDVILATDCSEEVEFLDRLSLHEYVLLTKPQKKSTRDVTNVISNYRKNPQFLLQSPPGKKGMLAFWEEILTENIEFVLILNPTKRQLWPLELRYNETILVVEEVEVKQISLCCSSTQLLVKKYLSKKNNVIKEKKIWVYELLDWNAKELIPGSITNILCLLQHLRRRVKEDEKILVVSHAENNASVLTTVLFNTLEKYEQEKEVDVYGFLRAFARSDRFKIQPVEVQFLYNAIVEYLNNFDMKKHVYEYMI